KLLPSLMVIRSKSCMTIIVNVFGLMASTVLKGDKPMARRPSKPPQNWSLVKKSLSRRTAWTGTDEPSQMFHYQRGLTSTSNWSETAGVGGIQSMHQTMWSCLNYNEEHDDQG